jgi:hypothetical protein
MSPVREDIVARALRDVAATLYSLDIDYVAIGGIPSALHGVDKPVRDIDIFLREEDVSRVLDALSDRGFEPETPEEDWLMKATRDDILVDLIFRIDQRIRLTDEMLERARLDEVMGTEIRIIGPEDLVLSLAVTDKPDTHYWKDALVILRNAPMDWSYLLRRAEEGTLRMLALLLHAVAYGIEVPRDVLATLVRTCAILQDPADEGYLAAHAKAALVEDARVSEPSLDVSCAEGTITVRGTMPTEERRRAIEVVLRERFPDAGIDNQVRVSGTEEPVEPEHV